MEIRNGRISWAILSVMRYFKYGSITLTDRDAGLEQTIPMSGLSKEQLKELRKAIRIRSNNGLEPNL